MKQTEVQTLTLTVVQLSCFSIPDTAWQSLPDYKVTVLQAAGLEEINKYKYGLDPGKYEFRI